VLDFLRVTTDHLARKGFDSPRLEAEHLLSHVLRVNRVGLYLQFDRPLSPEEIGRFRTLLRRRLNNVPLQWILGETEFFGHRLAQRSGVFIPRPETEILVGITRDVIRKSFFPPTVVGGNIRGVGSPGQFLLLDIGTGSGAIALALAAEIPELTVHGCDISPVALELAQENAKLLKLDNRVSVAFWDIMDFKIPVLFENPYHWITMNPPYIPSGDWDKLPPEVKAEPKGALDGGPDGLDYYRRLCELLPDILLNGGGISVEVGIGQSEAVVQMLSGFFPLMEKKPDLGGIDRVVFGMGFRAGESD
jgi:release factor glutamine methyltransferase